MKDFKDICRMSQQQVKDYMKEYLTSKQYEVINEDGFLYAKGTHPVLLLAHMDTVHKNKCTTIKEKKGRISSPQGIGGDDRCGIFIIMNLVNELHCSVLLCEDEETGGVGARKFAKTDYVKDLGVHYMVEFDRRGKDDAVFYSCDNKTFTEFITSETGFKEARGSFSDISVVAPAAKIAAVNLSSGYYNAHTTEEYVEYNEMLDIIETAKALIETETEEPFEYIEKKYEWNYNREYNYSREYCGGFGYGGFGYQRKDNYAPSYKQQTFADYAARDFDINLEVVWIDEEGNECVDDASGNTKTEAWTNFFLANTNVCFDMIVDYSFC